jgi:two-component system chemotaxis response regulator CheB
MPDLLQRLVSEQVPQKSPAPTPALQISETEMPQLIDESRSSKPSEFACPECGGVLWETDESGLLRFRCRVGHAYTARHLRTEQRYAVETALWAALRVLEESVSLYRRMAERTRSSNRAQTSSLYEERAANAEANARTLRDFLVQVGSNRETDTVSE